MKERDFNSLKCGNYNKFIKYHANLLKRFKSLFFTTLKDSSLSLLVNILREINLN